MAPPRSQRQVQAVLFDAVGTLFDLAPGLAARLIAAAARLGHPTSAEVAHALVAAATWPADTDDQVERRAGWLTFTTSLLSEVAPRSEALASEASTLRDTILDPRAYAYYADVLPAFEALTDRGVRIGIVSNFDDWLPAILAHNDRPARFETVVLSCELGCSKPDSRLFTRALDDLGVPAGATWYVGDSPRTDMGGARGAGLTAVLIDRDDHHRGYAGVRIGDLRELPAMIDAAERAA